MLHILWLILKFILILLGIVLGLLLLAILLILFCPVRYRASGTKEQDDWKKIRGEGQVSWLFHGVVLRAVWAEGNLQTSFRLFGIPVDKILNRRKKTKEHSSDSVESTEEQRKIEDQREIIEPEKIPEKPVNAEAEKMISSPVDSQLQDAPEKPQQETDSDKKEKKTGPVRKLLSGIQSKRKRIWDRIHHIRATLSRDADNLVERFSGTPKSAGGDFSCMDTCKISDPPCAANQDGWRDYFFHRGSIYNRSHPCSAWNDHSFP